MEYENKMSLES